MRLPAQVHGLVAHVKQRQQHAHTFRAALRFRGVVLVQACTRRHDHHVVGQRRVARVVDLVLYVRCGYVQVFEVKAIEDTVVGVFLEGGNTVEE